MHRSSARHRRSSSSMSCARRGGGPCSLIFGSGGRWCIVVCGGGGLNSGAAGVVYINRSDGDYMACDGTLRLMSRLVDVLEGRGGRWLGPTYQGLVDDYTAFVKTLDVKLAAGTIRLLDVKLEKVRWKMDHRLSENWYEPSGLN